MRSGPAHGRRRRKRFALLLGAARAEIVGCCLPCLWLGQGQGVWLLVPAAAGVAVALAGMGIVMFQPR